MKKEKFQIILLILILMFGLGSAYFKFLLLPQWTVIQSTTNHLLTRNNYYQELLTYQEDQSGLEQEIKTLDAKVKQLDAQLPSRLDKPQIMVGLYTLAKQHSVAPESIAFEQVQTKGNYQEMTLSFSCSGKIGELLAMIHDLQFGGNQRLAIKSISLTGSQQSMRAELKLMASAGLGSSNDPTQKPDFMNSQFGVDSPEKMFQP